MITVQAIQETTKINQASKQWALDNLDYINSSNKLLGTSLKVEKGESEGYYTSVLYMQPADKVSTTTLCAAAELFGCKKDCLIGSGMLGLTTGQAAATRRTILFLLDPDRFYSMLRKEVEAKYKKHGGDRDGSRQRRRECPLQGADSLINNGSQNYRIGGDMRTEAQNFTAMKGHVIDQQEILVDDKVYTLKNTMKGWMIYGPDGLPISGILPSAHDVEFFVLHGLGS